MIWAKWEKPRQTVRLCDNRFYDIHHWLGSLLPIWHPYLRTSMSHNEIQGCWICPTMKELENKYFTIPKICLRQQNRSKNLTTCILICHWPVYKNTVSGSVFCSHYAEGVDERMWQSPPRKLRCFVILGIQVNTDNCLIVKFANTLSSRLQGNKKQYYAHNSPLRRTSKIHQGGPWNKVLYQMIWWQVKSLKSLDASDWTRNSVD